MDVELWVSLSVWCGLIVFAAIVELQTNDLLSIFIIAGSIAAGVTSFITPHAGVQVIVFAASTTVCSAIFLPIFGLKRNKNPWNANNERMIGKVFSIVKYNKERKLYCIKVDGILWDVLADQEVGINDEVEVLGKDGNKLKVSLKRKLRDESIKKGVN